MHRDLPVEPCDGSDGRAPTEAWLFAQAIFGKPIPRIVRPEVKARAERRELEQLARLLPRYAEELRRLQAAEAKAGHDRELLECAARISIKCADELCALQWKEAEEREAWRRAEKFVESLLEGNWDPSKHPRALKGQPGGGQWIDKVGDGGAGSGPGIHIATASYSGRADVIPGPLLGNPGSRSPALHGDAAQHVQSRGAFPASHRIGGEPDILNPASQQSVSRAFWEAIRHGDWKAAEDVIKDIAHHLDKTKPQTIKTALKQIRGLDAWRKQASKWAQKRIRQEIKALEKTLKGHLTKRGGVDTAETLRFRYQLDFLKGLLK